MVFQAASPGHTWEPCWLILIHVCTSAQSQCHGVNPIRESHWPVKRPAIGWLGKVTFAVRQRMLSSLQILTCDEGWEEKSLFFLPRYEKVTFAGVVWRRERERWRFCRYGSGGRRCVWHSNVCFTIRELGRGRENCYDPNKKGNFL